MNTAAGITADRASLTTAEDYLGVSAEQRYEAVSRHFPPWLLLEPIEFPSHHETFGWECLVSGCEGAFAPTDTRMLCDRHRKQFFDGQESTSLEEFLRHAEPVQAQSFGWALARRTSCEICGTNREAHVGGYCQGHANSLRKAKTRGISESMWRKTQSGFPPFGPCAIQRCVHDGELHQQIETKRHRLCRSHFHQWQDWTRSGRGGCAAAAATHPRLRRRQRQDRSADPGPNEAWNDWYATACDGPAVTRFERRGQVSMAKLPDGLQREMRYAIHHHANTARRTHWRPADLQKIVDILAQAGVNSLTDAYVTDLAGNYNRGSMERRILLGLPNAARSLIVTEEIAKAAGWFDPIIVGSPPFPGTQVANRRKPWDLTAVSQHWLRDLLWDYLRDEAQKPKGKRPVQGTVSRRIAAIILLSYALRQVRDDHGDDPQLLSDADARAVKELWDLWFRAEIPLAVLADRSTRESSTLNERTRHLYMSSSRIILRHSRENGRTPPTMDLFILNLPEYSRPKSSPRPRPLTYGDFQLLVSSDNIKLLEDSDREDVGLADIWLTQAFQGGRISETMQLRLGCVGLVGNAQPYLWRDIAKVNVVDYGTPCYLPVYERLLRRQEKTRAKLRQRYAEELAHLDVRGQAALNSQWDRGMPLFPGATQNPDLFLEVSQSLFRDNWTAWFETLGLKGITTHQTRATLATSLLNNGAPAALVRQLLGHFSTEALAHYANYNNDSMTRHLQQVWAAGPGMDKPGTILLRPADVKSDDATAAAARIDLTVVPVEHGLCRYGPVIGGANCPFGKNCSNGPTGPCEHFVLTGADLAYWERKRDAAYHFAEGAPTDGARDYILSQWHPWEPVLSALREALNDLGLLEEAEKLDLRTPVHDYFDPLFSTGWPVAQLDSTFRQSPEEEN